MTRIAMIGVGNMGEALLAGLIRAGENPSDIVIAEKRDERAAEIVARYGVQATDAASSVASAETVFLVVKPQDMGSTLDLIASNVRPDAVVVSIAAGITTAFIEQKVASGTSVIRVMPNTPALVEQGMAGMSPGAHATAEHLARIGGYLAAIGRVVEVPESMQDAVTATSGSGPAYLFYVAEAMIAAAVELGLSPENARELTVQTLYGAATMLRATDEDPAVLRNNVTSPGGTTAAAIRTLDEHGVREAFAAALTAGRDRSIELAAG